MIDEKICNLLVYVQPMHIKSKSLLYLLFSLIPFLYAVYCYLPMDIWNDEMYTLKYFTFTHWSVTLTDYHIPNNHIFYNILNRISLSLVGINTLDSAIQHHWILRILPLTTSIITALFVFKIADRYVNQNAAWLSLAILMSTLPWLNHFLQIRGYSLSTMLFTINLYLIMRLIDGNSKKISGLLLITTAFLLYTIPLNMYYILPVFLFSGIFAVLRVLYSSHTPILQNILPAIITSGAFRAAFASGLGVLLGLAMYGPLISVIFNNDIVNTNVIPPAEFFPLLELITSAFLNKRYFIIPISILGFLFLFTKYTSVKKNTLIYVFFLIALSLMPFAIASFRGDPAPDRSFVMLAPVFALLLGSTAGLSLQMWNEKYIPYGMFSILIYNSVISLREMHLMHNMLRLDIVHNMRIQNINRAYYLAHFESHTGVRIFNTITSKCHAPLIIHSADHHGIRGYLDTYQIPWLDECALDSMYQTGKAFYLLHTAPMHIQAELSITYPKLKCIQLLPEYDFHNYCYCKQIPVDVTEMQF